MPSKYNPKYLTATEKTCGRCKERKPLEEFGEAPGHAGGLGRKDHCKKCHKAKAAEGKERAKQAALERRMATEAAAAEEAKLRAVVIEDKTKELLQAHMPKAGRERIEAPHITEALEATLREMQRQMGLDGETALQTYARVFVGSMSAAMQENNASTATQRYHNQFQQMIKASTEHRQSAPDVAEFYDETEIWRSVAEKALPALPVELLDTQSHRLSDEALIAEYHARQLHLKVVNEPTP